MFLTTSLAGTVKVRVFIVLKQKVTLIKNYIYYTIVCDVVSCNIVKTTYTLYFYMYTFYIVTVCCPIINKIKYYPKKFQQSKFVFSVLILKLR